MKFVKCPHTCGHAGGAKTESGIIWYKGSTYTTHVRSKIIHPACGATCPAYPKKNRPRPDDVTEEDWQQFANATFKRFFDRKEHNLLALSAIPREFLSQANQEKLSTVVGRTSGEQSCCDKFLGSMAITLNLDPGERTPTPPIAGPSGHSRSPIPLPSQLSPPPERAPSPRCSGGSPPPPEKVPSDPPSPARLGSPEQPAFQPSLVSPPQANSTPRGPRILRDVSIGLTPRRSRTFRDVSVGMTPRKLCDAGVGGTLAPKASEEVLSEVSEFNGGMALEPFDCQFPSTISSWTTQNSGIRATSTPKASKALSKVSNFSGRTVPELVDWLPSISDWTTQNLTTQAEPACPPSPSWQPRGAFHTYAGAFPSQAAAMNNGHYKDTINVVFVADPQAASTREQMSEDHRMVQSDYILKTEMTSAKNTFRQHVFEDENGRYTYWEWVSRLRLLGIVTES